MKTCSMTKKVLLTMAAVLFFFVLCCALTANASAAEEGTPVETWNISATANDNVVAKLYNDPDNEGYYTLVISGEGRMKDYSFYSAPWYSAYRNLIKNVNIETGVTSIGDTAFLWCTELTSIEIPDGVTSIGDHAFEYCGSLTRIKIPDSIASLGKRAFYECCSLTSIKKLENIPSIKEETFAYCKNITDIKIPESVTSIGTSAFVGCSSLASIEIPKSVMSIGDSAFSGCVSLTSIEIPNGVTRIGRYSFQSCSKLTSIKIPESIKNIGEWAFAYCGSLTNIELPLSVTSIENDAFHNCVSLTSIEIPEGITTVGKSTFVGCSGLTSIKIPDGVTSIGKSAFSGCSGLTSIKIPDGVTSIAEYAFSGCSGLTSIKIPDGVTSIAEYAFSGCSELTSIKIPDGATSIEGGAFSGCSGLTSIEIPKSVKSIGNSAFSGCVSLTSIEIPNGVTRIESGTFKDCNKLTYIELPDGITSIGNLAFAYCNELKGIEIPNNVTDIGHSAFRNCTSLTSIKIPNGIKSIGDYTFAYCSNLSNIEIPDSVTNIGNYAITYCNTLTSIELHEGITSIGDSAFSNCHSLKSINIPESITSIGSYAFCDCKNLISMRIPGNVTVIKNSTFEFCYSLTKVEFTEGIVCIGERAFCHDPLISINIPKSVTSIESNAFIGKTQAVVTIDSIDIAAGIIDAASNGYIVHNTVTVAIRSDITEVGSYITNNFTNVSTLSLPVDGEEVSYTVYSKHSHAEDSGLWQSNNDGTSTCSSCGVVVTLAASESEPVATWNISATANDNVVAKLYNDPDNEGYYTLVISGEGNMKDWRIHSYPKEAPWYSLKESIKTVHIEYGVKNIGIYAFYRCNVLTNICIPDSVSSIGSGAFSDCSSLTSILIPNGVTSIENGTFQYCRSLTSIEIPKGVTVIGEYAFYCCDNLKSITIPDSVVRIGLSAFGESSLRTDVLDVYITDIDAWCRIEFESYSNTSPSNPLGLGGTLYKDGIPVTEVTIPSDIEKIGAALYYCSTLTKVNIPEGVKVIGNFAFFYCSNLESIEIPEGVTSIGDYAFGGCSSLKSIEIPEGVTSIGNYTFGGCSSLTSIQFPEGVTSIGEYAFNQCSSLKSIEIPKGVTNIGSSAFSVCKSLTSIHIPEGVTSIGSYAFYDCQNLKLIVLDSQAVASAFSGSGSQGQLTKNAITVAIRFDISEVGSYITDNFTNVSKLSLPVDGEEVSYTVYSKHSHAEDSDLWQSNNDGTSTCSSCGVVAVSAATEPEPVETWDISATANDNVIAKLYPDTDNVGYYTLVISGEGSMADWGYYKYAPWYSSYKKLIKNVVISFEITNIGDNAFYWCVELTGIEIPNSVTSIGNHAFEGCSKLKSIEIPDDVTSIGDYAFSGCVGLTGIEIPKNVTSIGGHAFSGCSGIKEVHITDIDAWCRICFESASNPMHSGSALYLNGNLVTEVVIPDDVEDISYIFDGCTSLIKVEVPDSVTGIGLWAFGGCTSLTSIKLPEHITFISPYAFSHCESLTEIKIPDKVTHIGIYAFEYCESLTSIEIPGSVAEIPHGVFSNCKSLVSVKLTNGLEVLGDYVFRNCGKLTSIRIPESVTSIKTTTNYESKTFLNCVSLELVILDSEAIASGMQYELSNGYLLQNADTVAIRSDITEIGNYITDNFLITGTQEILVDGELKSYIIYSKHSHAEDSGLWQSNNDGTATCSACGLKKPLHVCEWGDWTVDVEPDLGKNGHAFRVCVNDNTHVDEHIILSLDKINYVYVAPDCVNGGSYTYINDIGLDYVYTVEPMGHDEEAHEGKAATCTENGWNAYVTCSRCDYTTYEELPATDHDYDYAGAVYTWNSGYSECSARYVCANDPSHTVTEKTTNIGSVTSEPNCFNDGSVVYSADFENAELTDQVETVILYALNHKNAKDTEWFEGKPATCTEEGERGHYVCPDCGENVDAYGNVINDLVIPALNHHYGDWYVVTNPTYLNPGKLSRNCHTEGNVHTEWHELPAFSIPNAYIETVKREPSCTEKGLSDYVYRIDGQKIEFVAVSTDALGHTLGEWTDENIPDSCTEDGWVGHYFCESCEQYLDAYENVIDDINIPASHKYDESHPTVVNPTCGAPGYTYVICLRDGCGFKKASDWKNPVDHYYPTLDTEVIPDTCEQAGLYEGSCTYCGKTDYQVVDEIHHEYEPVGNGKRRCKYCQDEISVDGNNHFVYSTSELFGCDPGFGFLVRYDGAKGDIVSLGLVEVYDAYYINEYDEISDEHKERARVEIRADEINPGEYMIYPVGKYSHNRTYVARLKDGVSFSTFEGNAIRFTIIPNPKHSSFIKLNDRICIVDFLSNVKVTVHETSVHVEFDNYGAVSHLLPEVGDIVCITAPENKAGILRGDPNYLADAVIGKVIGYLGSEGKTVLVLGHVGLEEVFGELDVQIDVELDEDDIDITDCDYASISESVRLQLANDDGFKAFLAFIGSQVGDLMEGYGFTATEGENPFTIDPHVYIEGNRLVADVKVEINTPIKKGDKDFGKISVELEIKNVASFSVDGSAELTWLGGVRFDTSVTAHNDTTIDMDIKYTYEKSSDGSSEYIGNKSSKVVHRSYCFHVDSMNDSNKFTDYKTYAEYKENGYVPCLNCRPDENISNSDRINRDLDELLVEGAEYTHWPKTKEVIDKFGETSIFKKAVEALCEDAYEADSTKEMTVGTIGGVYAGFIVKLEAYFVFDFEIEAMVDLHMEKESEVTYGTRTTLFGTRVYKEEKDISKDIDVNFSGKLHAQAGIGVDGSVTFIDIVGVGVRLEVGLMVDVSGYAHVNMAFEGTELEKFELDGALRIEIDLYYKAYIYVRLAKFNIPLAGKVKPKKIPLFAAGPNKVYNDYPDEEETNLNTSEESVYNPSSLNIGELGVPVKYLYLGGLDSRKDSDILKYFEDETIALKYFEYVIAEDERNTEGVRLGFGNILYLPDDHEITVVIKLKGCNLISDKWFDAENFDGREVKKAYMLDEEHTIVLTITNHAYSLTESGIGNCSDEAYRIYTCENGDCGHTKKEEGYKNPNHHGVDEDGTSFLRDMPGKDPTCQEDGYTEHQVCTKCSAVLNKYVIKHDGSEHRWSDELKTHYYFKNSCDLGGYTYFECTVEGCDKISVKEYYDKFEHNMSEMEPGVASTCKVQGYAGYYKCSVCGYHDDIVYLPLDSDKHVGDGRYYTETVHLDNCTARTDKYYYCTECGEKVVDSSYTKEYHDYYSVEKKDSTCSEVGYSAHEACRNCGHKKGYTEYSKKSHTRGRFVVELKNREDCSAGAVTYYVCSACSSEFDSVSHDSYSHNWDKKAAVAPTCESYGRTEYGRCTRCEAEYGGNYIDPTGHTFKWVIVEAPTNDKEGKRDYVCHCGRVSEKDVVIPRTPYTDGLIYQFSLDDGYLTVIGVDNSVFNGSHILIPSRYGGYKVGAIGENAFASCPNLSSLTVPGSIEEIDIGAFKNCVNLQNFYYEGSLSGYMGITFSGDGYSMGFKKLYVGDAGAVLVEHITVDRSNYIPVGAFAGFTCIKSVTIKAGTSIHSRAFLDCTSLSELNLEERYGFIQIGIEAFKNQLGYLCCNLTLLNILISYSAVNFLLFVGKEYIGFACAFLHKCLFDKTL